MHCTDIRVPAALQVWSTKQAAPTAAIDLRANVCCVKYCPASAHLVAVGSADHSMHLYDLRNASRAIHVFAGPGAALSSNPVWLQDSEMRLKACRLPSWRWQLPCRCCLGCMPQRMPCI